MSRTWSRSLGIIAGLTLLLAFVAACTTPTPPPAEEENDVEEGLDLAGTWSLEGVGPNLAIDGPMSLAFAGSTSGTARFLGRSERNGITTCRTYTFALIDDGLLLLQSSIVASEAFVVTEVNEHELTLVSDVSDFTLSRVTGPAPVADCGLVDLDVVAQVDGRPTSVAALVGVGSRLYFNRLSSTNPLAGYDLTTNSTLSDRTFTHSVGGGIDRYVMAALDDDVFYGHCWCGAGNRFSAFNATTNTHLVQVDSNADLGLPTNMRFGAYDQLVGKVWLGGRSSTASDVNRLFLLDPVTLTLDSHRTILNGASITDLTVHEGVMYALLSSHSVVAIGADGRATATWSIPRNAVRGDLRGLATAAGSLYLMMDDWHAGETVLVALTLE